MRSRMLVLSLLFVLTAYFTINVCGSTADAELTRKPSTGTVKLNKSSYIGLYSIADVTVIDQDLNRRPAYKDIARVRITSGTDARGLVVLANETGADTGVFTGSFRFGTDSTDNEKDVIMISPTDTIIAAYIDERNSDNKANAVNTAVAGFQFSEAIIETSAEDDKGAGNMLDITINEPDANMPKFKDRIIAKAGSGISMDDLTLYLEETGTNTGIFKCKLYFTENETGGQSLQIQETDKINIKYVDKTTPPGDIKEVVKTINWSFQSTVLKFDKEAYTSYNNSAKITLINLDLNKFEEKIEYVEVQVSTSFNSIILKLRETSKNSGEFSGTLYFGKSTNRSKGIIRVTKKDTVLISYTNEKYKDNNVECTAAWSPQDAEITLDKQVYKGNGALVKITVKDWDAAEDLDDKDTLKVIARVQGSAKYVNVTLTETNRKSGIFTGTLYINGSGLMRPSVKLNPADKLEVVYTDRDTTSGGAEGRTAYAEWME